MKWPTCASVGRRQPADDRSQGGRTRSARVVGEWFESGDDRPERLRIATSGEEGLGGADDLERVGLARVARVAPRRDAVAAEDDADRLRVGRLARPRSRGRAGTRAPPRHPHDAITEALLGQCLAVDRRGQGDARVGMEMIDVSRVDETVHRRVDRRCGAAPSVQAVVERGDHLVLSFDAGVDVDERPHTIEAQHGQTFLRQRAEVAAGALHPQQLDRSIGDRIDVGRPWRTCSRRRSSCCEGRRRAGSTERSTARRSPQRRSVTGPPCVERRRRQAPDGLRAADTHAAPSHDPSRSTPSGDRRPRGRGRGPCPIRISPRSGRTSVAYASINTALAPSTSPAAWAPASASASTSSALAVASWTFITERI